MAKTGECKAVRFMDNNVILNTSAAITASSASATGAAVNVADENRTKFWKAAGNFEIDSTNDTIYIDDGAPASGAIPAGAYTGVTLAAAIETVLNGISSGWTVTYSTSTYLFSFTHSTGADLDVSLTTDAIWDDIGFTGVSDITLAAGIPELSDEIRIHSQEHIDFDLGTSAYAIEFFGFIPDVGNAITISNNATVRLRADNIPITFSATTPIDETLTRDDRGYLRFLDDIDDTSYRYWQLLIEDRTNGNGPDAVAGSYAYVGDYLTFTGTNVAKEITKALIDPTIVQTSQSGRRFFNVKNRYNVISDIGVQLPSRADRLAFEQFAHDFALSKPFFISIDPGLKISDSLVELTLFCRFDDMPNFGHRFLDLYDIAPFSITEVV